MDMRALLEKMMKFAGGADQKSGPAGQLRGGTKTPKKGSSKHPAYHKLVGDSIEPEGNMLEELANEVKDKSLEWTLAEAWAQFKEEAFKDTAERRPARKGSRPNRGHVAVPRYKKVEEATQEETWQGWKIRYETTPQIKGQPLRWMVWHTKRGTESAHEGSANTPQEAVAAAKAWIQSGGNAKEITSSSVTIDFNVKFANEIVNGNDFYAKIVEGPTLLISSDAKPGFKRSHIRTQKSKATQDTTLLPMISLTNTEAKSAGLKAHGRYILGDTQQGRDGTLAFPLIYQSSVQAKGDMMRLSKPGLTVAMNREVSGLEETDQCINKEKITKFHKKLDTLVHSTFGKRKDEMNEDTESNLQPGTPIMVWLGPPSNNPPRDDKQHWTKGVVVSTPERMGREWQVLVKTDAFGQNIISPDRVFVLENSMNENAEELNVGDDVIITGPVEHQGETGVIDSFGQDKRFVVVNLYNHGKKSFHSSDVSYNDYADSDAEEAEMYDRDPDFRDWAAKQEVDESQGDPHKILINKLRDIERKPSAPSADDNDAARAEQAKADYAKYVAKMKKKDPNFVPLYKMDEYGAAGTSSAAQTTSTSTTPTATASPEEKQKAAKMTQAATTVKSAIGTNAPATSVVKALDTATQGKTVGSQDMKILEPMMKDMATVAQEPRLANQFKTLVNQINQAQRQQAK